MAFVQASDFTLFTGSLINTNTWDSNWTKVATVLSAGTYDAAFLKLGVNTLTLNYQANIKCSALARALDIAQSYATGTVYGLYTSLTGASTYGYGNYVVMTGITTANYGFYSSVSGATGNYGYYNGNNGSFDKLAYVTSAPSATPDNGTIITGYVSAQGKLYIRINSAWHYVNTTAV